MKLCIFGSRAGVDPGIVATFVMALPERTIVVTGGAAGVDQCAALVAHEVCHCPNPCRHVSTDPEFRNLAVVIFDAQWSRHGRAAGPIRNAAMVAFADAGQGFRCEGKSSGTDDAARRFERAGKPVRVSKNGA